MVLQQSYVVSVRQIVYASVSVVAASYDNNCFSGSLQRTVDRTLSLVFFSLFICMIVQLFVVNKLGLVNFHKFVVGNFQETFRKYWKYWK